MKKPIYLIACVALTVISCGLSGNLSTLPTTAKPHLATPAPEYAMVCMAGTLNFRQSAGTTSAVLVTLPDGEIVEVLSGRVITADGAGWRETGAGWVNERYLCLEVRP